MAADVQNVEVFTFAEAGRRLGISRQAVFNLVESGKLGTVKVMNRRYVSAYSVRVRLDLAHAREQSRKGN